MCGTVSVSEMFVYVTALTIDDHLGHRLATFGGCLSLSIRFVYNFIFSFFKKENENKMDHLKENNSF